MEKQFVGFQIGTDRYCMHIMDVKEVVRENKITRLPDAPVFVEGIMNLRGIVIPVISIRKKLAALSTTHSASRDKETGRSDKLIIVSIDGVLIGFLVDALDRVFSVDSSQIQSPEKISDSSIDRSLIDGVIKLEDTVYLILEIKKILDIEEKSFIKREIVE